MRLKVSADIEYLDGTLAGMGIPAGYTVHVHSMSRALTVARKLGKIKREGGEVRASVTGNRYRIVGPIAIEGGQ